MCNILKILGIGPKHITNLRKQHPKMIYAYLNQELLNLLLLTRHSNLELHYIFRWFISMSFKEYNISFLYVYALNLFYNGVRPCPFGSLQYQRVYHPTPLSRFAGARTVMQLLSTVLRVQTTCKPIVSKYQ